MAKLNLTHRRSDGETGKDFSSSCPKCGYYKLTREIMPEKDFDETGWYNVVKYSCEDPKCKHTWTEKIYISEGGQAHYYGK